MANCIKIEGKRSISTCVPGSVFSPIMLDASSSYKVIAVEILLMRFDSMTSDPVTSGNCESTALYDQSDLSP